MIPVGLKEGVLSLETPHEKILSMGPPP